MRRFELLEPTSIAEACQILAEREEAKVIAGGTALLILIKQGVYLPATLVNLHKVQGSREVSYDPQRGLRIGALASIYEVETAAAVRQHYPVLAEACHVVANIRIRNLATIGGNLAHADYQSDPPGALIALDGRVELTSSRGTREVALLDFLRGSYETALEPTEILTAVLVPPAPPDLQGTYLKFTTRSSEDRPCAGVTALVQTVDGVCGDVRLVVGAVSPTPVRVAEAEALARGEQLTAALLEQMAASAARALDPIDDVRGSSAYKRKLVRVLARRALAAASGDGVSR
jgi:carbon-monoxide dehydrogenase medium subunit